MINLTLPPDGAALKRVWTERLDDLLRRNFDPAEDRTPIYVPKIPKNVYETILNGFNLFNLLTLFKL